MYFKHVLVFLFFTRVVNTEFKTEMNNSLSFTKSQNSDSKEFYIYTFAKGFYFK